MKIIDIHTHGICGHDTRTNASEDILRMAGIQASCGVTAILPTLYPDTIEVMRKNMTAVKRAMEVQESGMGRGGFSLPQGRLTSPLPNEAQNLEVRESSIIIGVHLEGPFLNPLRCGALNAAAFLEPTEYNLMKLLDGFEDIVKIVTIAPEMAGATNLIKKLSGMGIIASMGHSDATWAEAEAGLHAGAKGITHLFNAMRGIHHREPGIAGFGLLNHDIYAEVIADPHHLHPKTLELIFRTKNPDRIILISDSVKETGDSGEKTGHGVVDFSGRLQGGSMTIAESSKRLIELGFDEGVVKNCISKNPATYLSA